MNHFENHGGTQNNAPGGTQNFGIPPEQLSALIAQAIAPLAEQVKAAGVKEQTIRVLAQRVTEKVQDWDEAVRALEDFVTISIRVQEEGRHGTNLGDFVDEVLRRTAALSAEGKHQTAISEFDAALAQEEAESQARTHRLLTAAIDQHLLAFDATGAAGKIARRVDLETPDPAARFGALRAEFIQWYKRGRDKGLRLDLEASIALARLALPLAVSPDQRGTALNDLGTALATLGTREASIWRLEEAVAVFRAALQEWTRHRVPLDWAAVQNNLGTALLTLGQRDSDTIRIEEAVLAFRSALEERTRDRVPLAWAMTQNNLGNALRSQGERDIGTSLLEAAVEAYRAALEERTRARMPLEWAAIQNNLGNALRTLGERENGTRHLREAVDAFRAALEERTRDRVPLEWAMTQNNLGIALQNLGELEIGTPYLEEAVAAYRAALEESTRDRVPLDWAMTQNNLGTALWTLGELKPGKTYLAEALEALDVALEERARNRVPLDWAATRGNMSSLHLAFFDVAGDTAELDLAQAALDDARAVFTAAQASQYLAMADNQQAEIDARRRR